MHQEKATLQRQLKPMHVWAVAFGCIVGWGSFINPGKKFLPNSGVAGTAIAMALGALVISRGYGLTAPRWVGAALAVGGAGIALWVRHGARTSPPASAVTAAQAAEPAGAR